MQYKTLNDKIMTAWKFLKFIIWVLIIVPEIWGGALNTNSKIVLYDQDYWGSLKRSSSRLNSSYGCSKRLRQPIIRQIKKLHSFLDLCPNLFKIDPIMWNAFNFILAMFFLIFLKTFKKKQASKRKKFWFSPTTLL